MDTVPSKTSAMVEGEAEQAALERGGIVTAEREIADGLYVDYDDVRSWADSLGTPHHLPTPPVRRR